MRLAKGLNVPGTVRSTGSIFFASVSMATRSLPKIFRPSVVRMPVDSMSVRILTT